LNEKKENDNSNELEEYEAMKNKYMSQKGKQNEPG
jgi:hypothetical protein